MSYAAAGHARSVRRFLSCTMFENSLTYRPAVLLLNVVSEMVIVTVPEVA